MSPTPPILVDARGHRCPTPVLRLQRALRGVADGVTVVLRATDPMARIDVPFFCGQGGHQLQDTVDRAGFTDFIVIKGRSTPRPAP